MNISARSLLSVFFRRLPLIAGVATLTTIAAVAFTLLTPISYKTSALVMVKPGRYMETNADSASALYARQEQYINSLTQILRSEEVMRRAISTYGVARLYPDLTGQTTAGGVTIAIWQARREVDDWRNSNASADATPRIIAPAAGPPISAAQDRAVQRGAKALIVGAEPKSDLIWVFFTHKDPKTASEFTNVLLDEFRLRTIELSGRSGAAEFFGEQKQKYDAAYEKTSQLANDFAVANNIYSISDQRRLILDRRNELLSAIVKTRSGIVEKRNQATATADEVAKLRPIAQYPQIQRLAKTAPKAEPGETSSAPDMPDLPNASTTQPLLLVKVYQETVQNLVKLKTDVAGLAALEHHQNAELAAIDAELKAITENGAKYERLQLEVNQAREAAEQYASYATKEQLGDEVGKKGLSTIEIAQAATTPNTPAFPNPMVIIPFGMAGGVVLGFALAVLRSVAAAHKAPATASPEERRLPAAFEGPTPIAAAASNGHRGSMRATTVRQEPATPLGWRSAWLPGLKSG